MRDKLFFPLAALLTVLMVFLAIQPGIGRLPTGAVAGDGLNYNRIVIEGPYLNKVISGGDARAQLIREDGTYYLYIEAAFEALVPAPELGPHFRLAPDIEVQFAAQTVRVTASVRPADSRGAEQVEMNYSTGRAGDSGWQVRDLQPGFSEVSFEYDVPALESDQGVDYLGIRPVVPDKSRALIVERIVLERLP
ncbi:hypothetical protein HNE_0033 [Hyphomonas neptunium ATCC 15444]|uniref:Uncharacterized protein n=2 Tax=Hyphomonas TaxID=85 RepID=Q0C676_HYPNA|nr:MULTISPECIES: hypothetical protein [Hyphomonas]ABI75555.1 hypothetical protein HNE_0033 [Hyphomonas neptunium ATCC 15444]KCZ94847.1 hypothetical protein HHI_08633 [Hyphomonas hirschiana VP5]